jgi:histone-lysine N-methyltransferase SETMAR
VQHSYNTVGRGREITPDHPAHSPDLAPSDFHLFLHLKEHLAGQKFHEDEEVKIEVTAWLCAQAAEFCDIGIHKLIPKLNKMP